MNPQLVSRPGLLPAALLGGVGLALLYCLRLAAQGTSPVPVLAVLAALIAGAASHRVLLRWRVLVATLAAVILFIPIRRYTLPAGLPFDLEPYRLLVAALVAAWAASLLVDPATRLRRGGWEAPLVVFIAGVALSVVFNSAQIEEMQVSGEVVKSLTFLTSFVLVMYLVGSVLTGRRDIDTVVQLLVAGGAVIALFALLESRTHDNLFNDLGRVIPMLDFHGEEALTNVEARGGRLRAYASAQHPIALGAALAMLVPLGIYLYQRTRSHIWSVATGILLLGVFTTVSRTAIAMAGVVAIVFMFAKPAATRRVLPVLILPLLVVVHMAAPGALGGLKSAFMPEGGLIAEQKGAQGTYGSGRIADLGPALAEWSSRPFVGQGFGSRVTNREDPRVNAPILDNQWLALLLETGLVGVAGLVWLFMRAVRRLVARARREVGPESWLSAGLAASIAAYGVGMFTFDSFSFIQVTMLLFVMLGLGIASAHQRA
jgi:polysaccharide biosynthesis protein PslJ